MRAFVSVHKLTYHMYTKLTCTRCSEGNCLKSKLCLAVSLTGLCHGDRATINFLSDCSHNHGHLADIFLYMRLQAATRMFVCTHASRMTGCAHS